MRAIVLYGSMRPGPLSGSLDRVRQAVQLSHGHTIYVRAELRPAGEDLQTALDQANPMRGEVVLNTMEVPE